MPNLDRVIGFGVGEDVEYTTLGGEIQYQLSKRYSLSLGYHNPVQGKNLLAGWAVFGVGIEF